MNIGCAIIAGLLAVTVPHGTAASDQGPLVTDSESWPTVASFVEVEAEFVTVRVDITSSDGKALESMSDVEATFAELMRAAAEDTLVVASTGVASVSPQYRESSSFRDKYSASSEATMYLSVRISGSRSPFEAAGRIQELIASVERSCDARVNASASWLTIGDPESYRGQLLSLIANEAASMKDRFGVGTIVSISGLERPVIVQAKDDRRVFVTLPYELSVRF